jgi:DNA polymerase I
MSLDNVQLEYIDSFDKAMEFKRWLGERHGDAGDVLGVDTETTGLHMFTPESNVRLIQFGDAQMGWAMSWELWKGLALEVLTQWQGDYVGHNFASFDVKFIEAHSTFRFPRHRIHDTMLQAHIVDPLGPGTLKTLARRLIDSRAVRGQQDLDAAMSKNGWGWDTVPVDFPAYHLYGALDPVLSVRLHEKFMKKVGPGCEWAEVYDLELAVRHVVTRMEQRGMRVDVDYALKKSDELMAYAERTREWGKQHYGINLGSGQQLVKIFQGMGANFEVFSEKTGAPSTDKQQLAIFADDSDPTISLLAKTVLNLRKSEKLGKDYLLKCANMAIPEADGNIIHASMRTLAARTSRMSISDPPLQQLSKQDATVRNAFIAREGNVLVTTDFSQIELRLLAHFSKDERLVEAFRDADSTGGDFFVNVAREVYQDPGFQKSDKRRGLVKSMIYGLNYGAGVHKMAETAGVGEVVMRDVVQRLEKAYPGIRGFMRQIEHVGVARERSGGQGYVVTPYGRRLPCDDGKVYTLVNYLLQGHAAEYFKRALVNLDAAGWGEVMLVPVHDEIVMDLPEGDAEQARKDVPLIMQNLTDYAVPLLAESDGPYLRWGEKYQ